MNDFNELLKIMKTLRQKCPWDQEQSIDSLRTYLLEEAYECVDAMHELPSKGPHHLIEELGDVLLQVVFQAEILSESAKSRVIDQIIDELCKKLVRRHPHVFGDELASNSQDVLKRWDEIKKSEKNENEGSQDRFAHIPKSITSSQRAQKIGKLAKKMKFDWENSEQVWAQVQEEFKEVEEAKTSKDQEEELGDLLFSLAQWARHKKIDLEVCLQKANKKFENRFREMEKICPNSSFEDLDLSEKENLWKRVKENESKTSSS